MSHSADAKGAYASSGRPDRREVVRYLSTAMAGAAISRRVSAGTNPFFQFPTEPRARLSVTSYPFRAYIESPTNPSRNAQLPAMDLKAFPGFVAEKFGIHNINPLAAHFGSMDPTYLDAFRAAVVKARSHVVDLGLGDGSFYSNDRGVRQQAVDFGRRGVDLAVVVGSPSVRQHVGGDKGQKPDIALAAESLGRLAEYGAKRNVVINLENDSAVSEDPFFLVAVIERAKNPYLRGLPDFGNSLAGHDAEFNRRAVHAMLGHAFNMCHVKDTIEEDNGKVRRVDLRAIFRLAEAASYRGFFSMEFETGSGDPVAGTRQLINETLQYLT